MIKKRIIIENFKKLGFNDYESEAYLKLLVHGPLSPAKLSSTTKIPRPRVYDILKGLASRGILLEQPNKPVNYSAVEIEKVIKILESEIKEGSEEKLFFIRTHSKSIIKEFKELKSPKEMERFFVLKDTKNLVDWLRIEGMNAKKFINIVDSFDRGLFPRAFKNYIEFAKRMRQKGVEVRYCLPIEKWNLEELKKVSKFIQIKHLPLKIKVGLYLIDRKQLMITTSTFPNATFDTGVLIKDNEIIELAEMNLKRIWEEGLSIEERENELK